MTNTTTTDTTADLAGLTVADLRLRATELGIDPKGLKKADLLAAIDGAVAAESSPVAKRQATRAAKANDALGTWGKAIELGAAQDEIRNARELLAHWTAVRDELVHDARANEVPFSVLAELLDMAQPGVRAITLRQAG